MTYVTNGKIKLTNVYNDDVEYEEALIYIAN